jgi:nicotinate-nucleotide pyrophosphorylase (carboxylating)
LNLGAERPPADLAEVVARALAEDLGPGDVTADLVPEDADASAMVLAREPAVLCGSPWAEEVFLQAGHGTVHVGWLAREGDPVAAGEMICTVEGPARAVLTGERTALNFLQTLSGTATTTRRYVDALAGTGTRLLDTRKTLPGLRSAQKYATRIGGAVNHRMGLWDMVLVKENHIAAAGSIGAAVERARALHPGLTVEVEAEDLAQLEEALAAGADWVLLDNFPLDDLAAAVARTGGRATLEASGSMELEALPAVAATGVDYVSVGAITKHLRAVDLSLRFV